MKLAYVTMPGRGRTDDLIAEAVGAFTERGLRLAGTVRARPVRSGAHRCDMDLRVLPGGRLFRISQPLGSAARGCRLDGDVMESIASEVEAGVARADLLIVNKFGKLEARGRGLCPAIALAMELGIPTLVGVNEMNVSDFLAFSDGVAAHVAPTASAIVGWYEAAVEPGRLAPA